MNTRIEAFFSSNKRRDDEAQWLPVSDLMAGLMMVFLFLSVSLMRYALIERDKIKDIAVAYQQNQVAIYQTLLREFEQDLEKWGAELDEDTLTFTFNSPEILFSRGSDDVNSKFKAILADFFPRYANRLETFQDSIAEVRIEGHTSSVWNRSKNDDESYFKNMTLSERRTRSVLDFVYSLPDIERFKPWMKSTVAAVALSSSRVVIDKETGTEDYEKSRRVTFRIITNADIQIKRILDV